VSKQRPSDGLLKLALRLQDRCGIADQGHERRFDSLAQAVIYHANQLSRQMELGRHASRHNWPAALARVRQKQADLLCHLRYLLSESSASIQPPQAARTPSLREWHEELLAINREFDVVNMDQNAVTVTTDPVELEGIDLGPFRIELDLDGLTQRAEASSFAIIALEPNPAGGADDVTHPHVRDESLCAGRRTTVRCLPARQPGAAHLQRQLALCGAERMGRTHLRRLRREHPL